MSAINGMVRAAAFAGLCGILVGCGANDRAPVSGRVDYLGQPVQNANIIIFAADGRHGTAMADAEGRYKVPNAPIGPAKVTVSGPTGAASGTELPAQYSSPDTTPLTITVKSGKNKFDIEVK